MLHATGCKKPEPEEHPVSTEEVIMGLFVRVDEAMRDVPLQPQGLVYPREIVTLGVLSALTGGGQRAFDRWLRRDYGALCPFLPARTRLFRLLRAHRDWTQRFLAAPPVLGVADSSGIALVPPGRERRNPFPLGEKGRSQHRGIVGAKRAVVLNKWGVVCGWEADAANVHDSRVHGLIRHFDGDMSVVTDQGGVAARGHPANMKPVKNGTWNERLLVETFYSMLTGVCHSTKMTPRVWAYCCMRLAFLVALVTILVQWEGLPLDAHGCGRRSIAQFSLYLFPLVSLAPVV
jgi:hypothetical protein